MLLDQEEEGNGSHRVWVWSSAAFQGEELQRCFCRQETQPEPSRAAAPACIPAPSLLASLPHPCLYPCLYPCLIPFLNLRLSTRQNTTEEAKEKVGRAGVGRAGAASSSTQWLPSVPCQPDTQIFPPAQLIDFPASNSHYFLRSCCSIPYSQPFKGTAAGLSC